MPFRIFHKINKNVILNLFYVGNCFKVYMKPTIPFKSLSFSKEINAFVQQGGIKLIKSDSKKPQTFIMYTFQINAVLLNFPFIVET